MADLNQWIEITAQPHLGRAEPDVDQPSRVDPCQGGTRGISWRNVRELSPAREHPIGLGSGVRLPGLGGQLAQVVTLSLRDDRAVAGRPVVQV